MESNFRIVKSNFEDKINSSFWNVFEVDSFGLGSGMQSTLQMEQVYAIVDKFEFLENISHIDMISELTHYLFINFGGSADTPAKEVLAFSYLLFSSPNLRMVDMFDSVVQGVHFNTVLRFLHENNKSVPAQFLSTVYRMIKDEPIYNMIVNRYPVKMKAPMGSEDFNQWMASTTIEVADYIKGVNATKAIQKLI